MFLAKSTDSSRKQPKGYTREELLRICNLALESWKRNCAAQPGKLKNPWANSTQLPSTLGQLDCEQWPGWPVSGWFRNLCSAVRALQTAPKGPWVSVSNMEHTSNTIPGWTRSSGTARSYFIYLESEFCLSSWPFKSSPHLSKSYLEFEQCKQGFEDPLFRLSQQLCLETSRNTKLLILHSLNSKNKWYLAGFFFLIDFQNGLKKDWEAKVEKEINLCSYLQKNFEQSSMLESSFPSNVH